MSRGMGYRATVRAAQAKRAAALCRPELAAGTAPRTFPASPTAMAVKTQDPETRAMVAEFLAKKALAGPGRFG